MFNTTREILTLSNAFAAATNRSPSTVSRLASGSGDTFARLERGHNLTMKRAQRIYQFFSDNWPKGTAWPKGIARPAPTKPKKTRRRTGTKGAQPCA